MSHDDKDSYTKLVSSNGKLTAASHVTQEDANSVGSFYVPQPYVQRSRSDSMEVAIDSDNEGNRGKQGTSNGPTNGHQDDNKNKSGKTNGNSI